MRVFKDIDLVEQLGSGMERIMNVYDESCFEFLPNFLRINFYFDKEVLRYLDQTEQENPQENPQEKIKNPQENAKNRVTENEILWFCKCERTLKEITEHFGYKDFKSFKNNYLNPLLKQGKLRMTIPDQPTNRNQKYISNEKNDTK